MPDDEYFEIEDLEQSIRDKTLALRKRMNQLAMRMFLRTTICFKNIGLFSAEGESSLYGNSYSGNHVAIFECELKAPPQLSYIDHNPKMITDAYRLNFKHWKIVDIDNFMDGNHYFKELTQENIWNAKVKELIPGPAKVWKEEGMNSSLYLE